MIKVLLYNCSGVGVSWIFKNKSNNPNNLLKNIYIFKNPYRYVNLKSMFDDLDLSAVVFSSSADIKMCKCFIFYFSQTDIFH